MIILVHESNSLFQRFPGKNITSYSPIKRSARSKSPANHLDKSRSKSQNKESPSPFRLSFSTARKVSPNKKSHLAPSSSSAVFKLYQNNQKLNNNKKRTSTSKQEQRSSLIANSVDYGSPIDFPYNSIVGNDNPNVNPFIENPLPRFSNIKEEKLESLIKPMKNHKNDSNDSFERTEDLNYPNNLGSIGSMGKISKNPINYSPIQNFSSLHPDHFDKPISKLFPTYDLPSYSMVSNEKSRLKDWKSNLVNNKEKSSELLTYSKDTHEKAPLISNDLLNQNIKPFHHRSNSAIAFSSTKDLPNVSGFDYSTAKKDPTPSINSSSKMMRATVEEIHPRPNPIPFPDYHFKSQDTGGVIEKEGTIKEAGMIDLPLKRLSRAPSFGNREAMNSNPFSFSERNSVDIKKF